MISYLLVVEQYRTQIVFFFQAEGGIRDGHVTGVQTCALPIFPCPPAIITRMPPLYLGASSAEATTSPAGHAAIGRDLLGWQLILASEQTYRRVIVAEAGLHPARASHARCVQTDPVSEALLSVLGPVTNQVTTPPGRGRRSQTQPDKTICLTCRNTTQRGRRRTKPACVVRRRSTVRFRSVAPAQRSNSNTPNKPRGPFRGPSWPHSRVLAHRGCGGCGVSCPIRSKSDVVDLSH